MTKTFRLGVCLALICALSRGAFADELAGTVWRVKLDTGRLGPVETHLKFEAIDGALLGRSLSGALDLIRAEPSARSDEVDLSRGLFALTVRRENDLWIGEIVAPWRGARISFSVGEGELTGSVEEGLFRGTLTGAPIESVAAVRDYPSILASVEKVVAARIFDPRDLHTDAYRDFKSRMEAIAASSNDDLDFLLGFRFAWRNEPFSHFGLQRSSTPARTVMAGFDNYRIGSPAARVRFDGDVAVLTVDTMMGEDTIEHIRAAYREIADRQASALVIDLRGNGGGAFAVKPLVEHVIDEPLEPGYFLSQKWNAGHERLPNTDELAPLVPWQGWSIISFWESVQSEALMKLRFEPAEPNFDGPVFVVVDGRSASATELAADAFRSSGLTTLVGERTAGQMLSQSFFDAAEGFIVILPVADYVSIANGRIEGEGVAVDVEIGSESALDRALASARRAGG